MAGRVDEVLVVDSSGVETRRILETRLDGTGARVVPAPALGCTEPLRPFAHAHLRHPWVLSVDTDEVVGPDLSAAIRHLPGTPSAYRVPRFERHLGSLTWHLRLYRPDRTRYEGWIHESPRIEGPVEALDPRARLEHEAEYDRYLRPGGRRSGYLAIESVERPFTGRSLGTEFPGRLTRLIAGSGSEPLSPRRAAWFLAADRLRRDLTGARDPGSRRQRRMFAEYLRARHRSFYGLAVPERREAAEVAGELRSAGGPIAYLGFDDPNRVARLAESVPEELDGGAVLTALLRYRRIRGAPMEVWDPEPLGSARPARAPD